MKGLLVHSREEMGLVNDELGPLRLDLQKQALPILPPEAFLWFSLHISCLHAAHTTIADAHSSLSQG